MARFEILGRQPLKGEVTAAGNKNAALPILAATVLTEEVCELDNVPEISDIRVMLEILARLGKVVTRLGPHRYRIQGAVRGHQIPYELGTNLRASLLFLGALLPVTGEVHLPPPGGCVIGRRKLDTHFELAADMGVEMEEQERSYVFRAARLKPAFVLLREASVTATANALLMSAALDGETVIENAAAEPHLVDLCQVLTQMGARIQGVGSNRLMVKGTRNLHGFRHSIVPDHIEAATFVIAAACLQGDLVVHQARRDHLRMITYYLKQMNVDLRFEDEQTLVVKPSRPVSRLEKIKVGPWPGFPTDLMSPMIVLATQARGVTLCHDWMYESRMFFVDKLSVMGANIVQCDPHRVLVSGPCRLTGQRLSSPDIRAGIALVIAALAAEGRSVIERVELIDRGYERLEERLRALGARIERLE